MPKKDCSLGREWFRANRKTLFYRTPSLERFRLGEHTPDDFRFAGMLEFITHCSGEREVR